MPPPANQNRGTPDDDGKHGTTVVSVVAFPIFDKEITVAAIEPGLPHPPVPGESGPAGNPTMSTQMPVGADAFTTTLTVVCVAHCRSDASATEVGAGSPNARVGLLITFAGNNSAPSIWNSENSGPDGDGTRP